MEEFQSLLHQGISLLVEARPRAKALSFPFQSLLHQGISLLDVEGIPDEEWGVNSFNPFFIRASVYWFRENLYPKIYLKTLFQSLLHQGISLLALVFQGGING